MAKFASLITLTILLFIACLTSVSATTTNDNLQIINRKVQIKHMDFDHILAGWSSGRKMLQGPDDPPQTYRPVTYGTCPPGSCHKK